MLWIGTSLEIAGVEIHGGGEDHLQKAVVLCNQFITQEVVLTDCRGKRSEGCVPRCPSAPGLGSKSSGVWLLAGKITGPLGLSAPGHLMH